MEQKSSGVAQYFGLTRYPAAPLPRLLVWGRAGSGLYYTLGLGDRGRVRGGLEKYIKWLVCISSHSEHFSFLPKNK